MRLLFPFAALLLLVLGVLAFDGGEPRGDLVIVHRTDVFTLDPQRMSYQQDNRIGMALFEGLAVLDSIKCLPMPGAAERWQRSEDGRTWTFHLRPAGRWSNGDRVEAEDFRDAWFRAVLPDTAADYAGIFFLIEGAEDFFHWRSEQLAEHRRSGGGDAQALLKDAHARFDATVGVSAPDSLTLVVRLARPTAYFLDLLAMPACSPVHRPSLALFTRVDETSGALRVDPSWTRAGALISNGPYRLASWRYKRSLRLERNPHYWDVASVKAATVTVLPLEDNNTAVLGFDAEGSDWVTDVVVEYRADLLAERRAYEERHAAEIARLRATGMNEDDILAQLPAPRRGERRTVHAFDAFGTDFFSFNCRSALVDGRANPFADPRVRRAFSLAVDKETLVSKVTRLNERVAGALTPPESVPGYMPPRGLGYDTDAARAELAAAGWSDVDGDGLCEDGAGEPFPTVDLLYSTGNPRYEDLSLALRDMWQRGLGVAIELRAKEGKFYKDDLKRGNFMIARGGWYGDYGDPMTFLSLSRTGDGNNDRGYSNARFDAMLDTAEDDTDEARRLALLAEAERYLFEEELPLVPLCTYRTIYLYEPGRVRGLCRHPRLEQYLGRMWVE